MWASPPGRNNNTGSSYKDSTSPSKYLSSTWSSPAAPCSPPSTVIPSSLSAKKSMEEVWKDISLASLNDITPQGAGTFISTTTNNPTFPSSMILQEFLARPINKEPPRRSGVSNEISVGEETTFFGSLSPTPGTILSLNSGSDFKYIESGDPVRPNPAVNSRTTAVATPLLSGSPYNSSFHVFGSSTVFPSSCKKRVKENNENSEDRRHKLMMKNRESAARSRARKQAYTNELELEVARLVEENAKLRKHQEKLVAAPDQRPKMNSLSRTLTAPF